MEDKNINKKDIFIGAGVFAAVVILMYIFCGFGQFGISSPLAYNGTDVATEYVTAKQVGEQGWFWHNDLLGAPYGQDLYDFSAYFQKNFEFIVSKVIYTFVQDPAVTFNIQLLFNFALSALAAYLVLRVLSIGVPVSVFGALMYGLAPYIQCRGLYHLSLSAAYFVPLSILLCIWSYEDENGYLQFSRDFFKNRKNWASVLFVVLIANNGLGYYALFTCFLLCLTALLSFIGTGKLQSIVSKLKLVCLTGILFAVNMIPVAMYQINNGSNLDIARRSVYEGEIYGLKLAYFFIPNINTHGIKFLDDLCKTYYANMPLVNENTSGYLGLAGIIGFLIAVFLWLRASGCADKKEDRIAFCMSRLIAGSIILATVGGISGFLSIYFNFIRCYNRLSIFMAFMCIVLLAVYVQKLLVFLQSRSSSVRLVSFGVLLAAAAVCLTDQLPVDGYSLPEQLKGDGLIARSLPENACAYESDAEFIKAVESRMQEGDMIYQLPYHKFPEGGAVNGMFDYQHFTGFIHSAKLKWSYGGISGRDSDRWNQYVSRMEMPEFIETICSSGFRGIYVDTRAYKNKKAVLALDKSIRTAAGLKEKEYLRSRDGSLRFYDLYPYMEKHPKLWEAEPLSMEEIRHPAYVMGTTLRFGKNDKQYRNYAFKGFSDDEEDFAWTSGRKAELAFRIDHRFKAVRAVMNVSGTYYRQQPVSIFVNKTKVYEGTFSGKKKIVFDFDNDNGGIIDMELRLPGALSPYEISGSKDTRELALQIKDLTLETLYKTGRTVHFLENDNDGSLYALSGLSPAEEEFTWTEGRKAVLKFLADSRAKSLRGVLNVLNTYNGDQPVEILINGKTAYSGTLNGAGTVEFAFPNSKNGLIYMEVELPKAVSPSAAEKSADTRVLALQIDSLKFEADQP